MALIKCNNCGKEISDSLKKCPFCNTKLSIKKEKICPECGFKSNDSDNFCLNCGYKFTKSNKKKLVLLALILVLVIASIFIIKAVSFKMEYDDTLNFYKQYLGKNINEVYDISEFKTENIIDELNVYYKENVDILGFDGRVYLLTTNNNISIIDFVIDGEDEYDEDDMNIILEQLEKNFGEYDNYEYPFVIDTEEYFISKETSITYEWENENNLRVIFEMHSENNAKRGLGIYSDFSITYYEVE